MPVAAVAYFDDMYLDVGFSVESEKEWQHSVVGNQRIRARRLAPGSSGGQPPDGHDRGVGCCQLSLLLALVSDGQAVERWSHTKPSLDLNIEDDWKHSFHWVGGDAFDYDSRGDRDEEVLRSEVLDVRLHSFSSFVTRTEMTPLISDKPSTRSSSGPLPRRNLMSASTRAALPASSIFRVFASEASYPSCVA